ncbi:MAG: helix-turn-helix transcriptional regulator [Chloroflexi bacterium]|nr:helix-turn-helix transcriptional regulator [Chloroflexota bacterium]
MNVDQGTRRLERTSELLKALASAARLGIVLELSSAPRCVHDLTERVGTSQSATSQHLRVLRNLRLVEGRRQGREVIYQLTDEHVGRIVADALQHVTERTDDR